MTTVSAKLMIIFMLFATVLVCSGSGKQPADARIPADYEIEDVRYLPQDIKAYAASCPGNPLGKTCRDLFLSEFRRKYYAPWTDSASISDVSDSVATMKDHALKQWYGENRRKVPRKVLEELLTNCDLDHLPSMKRPAVATAATDVRVFPTSKPLFESADDFPFDAVQNAALKLGEPVRVLHVSRDGLWLFVETSGMNGWVRSRDVGYIDKKLAKKWMKKAQIVIVRDFTLIRDKSRLVAQKAKVGTICPVDGEDGDGYLISAAVNAGKNNVREIKVKVPKESARKFPLAFGRESAALIGNELIGKPYGWGEMYQDRDCSSMLRDFYLPFGIWLPRGSSNQINSGRNISLAGLSASEKERLIAEKGVPFLTLLHMKGHIMLYVGSMNGKALVFHDTWGVSVRGRNGDEFKLVIGKSIVSTLTPGSELHLAGDTLLEKVSSMLVLGDRCAYPSH